jgi:hypothetical protein
VLDVQQTRHLLDRARISARHAARRRAQREGQVVEHRQMRIQRILLEHESDVALGRRIARHVAAADPDPRSGISRPAIRRSVVVLPAPVGPSSTTNSPSATVSDRSLMTAVTSPKPC